VRMIRLEVGAMKAWEDERDVAIRICTRCIAALRSLRCWVDV
jgi:hypothetical protein